MTVNHEEVSGTKTTGEELEAGDLNQMKNQRAWSDEPDHVIVRLANTEHGMDLGCASDLHEQIGRAILEAIKPKRDPFEKWLRQSNRRSHGACGWDDNDMREAFKAGQEAANTTPAPTQAHCSMCGERVPEADAQLRSAVYCGRCAVKL